MNAERRKSLLTGAAGIVIVIAVWWIGALTILKSKGFPTPSGVVKTWHSDGISFYWDNFSVTINEAIRGFVYGNVAALILASLVLLVPVFETVITQIATISYCIPVVAILPPLYIIIGPPLSGKPSGTAVALAAISCFFTTVVGAVLGFRSADRTSLDLVTVYGGGRWKQMRKVQLISALPAILSALQIAAPAAFLGAILGEYIGGVDKGVGPVLINAQASIATERAWGIALGCALVAGIGYGIFGIISKFVTPWSSGKVGP